MSHETQDVAEVAGRGWDSRIHLFRVGADIDASVVVTDRYVVFVDTTATPQDAALIVEAMRPDLDGRMSLVVLTHADFDHAWGNETFARPDGSCEATILGHRIARQRLQSQEERAYLEERQSKEPRFAAVRLLPPDVAFEGDLVVDGGDLTLHLFHTPGHAPDHVAVWLPEIRTLLAGDAAESPFPYVGDRADLPVLIRSLERLRALDPSVVIPCHGGTADPGLLARNLTYFAEVAVRAGAALAAGRVPAGWLDRQDLDVIIGMQFEEAVRALGVDAEKVSSFYRDAHRRAIRATLRGLAAGRPGTD